MSEYLETSIIFKVGRTIRNSEPDKRLFIALTAQDQALEGVYLLQQRNFCLGRGVGARRNSSKSPFHATGLAPVGAGGSGRAAGTGAPLDPHGRSRAPAAPNFARVWGQRRLRGPRPGRRWGRAGPSRGEPNRAGPGSTERGRAG